MLFLFVSGVSAQNIGDYQTRLAPAPAFGLWSTPSTWETWDGSAWVSDGSIPSSASGVVTILTGDSVVLNATASIDEVVIQNGGVLNIVNTVANTITLSNGPGDDISVSGHLYVGNTAMTLLGAAGSTVQVNSDGVFNFYGTLNTVVVNNDGVFNFALTSNIANSMLTNNNDLVWTSGTIGFNNSSIVNNDTIFIRTPGNVNLNSVGTTSISNPVGSVIFKQSTSTNAIFLPVTNGGEIIGTGGILFATTTANTGIISPGNNSAATLNVYGPFISNRPTTLNIGINSVGGVAGVNYDQVILDPNSGPVSLTNNTLNVTNNAPLDPTGTVYTILSYPTSTIATPFTTVNIPTNFTIQYNANTVTLTKIALNPLPVIWEKFDVTIQNKKVKLYWNTSEETGASHYIVEYSTDGRNFRSLGRVEALNSTSSVSYSFVHESPDLTGNNIYRIKQVDIDGKYTYSVVRMARFNQGKEVTIQIYPNPVKDVLYLNAQISNARIVIVDVSGREVMKMDAVRGTQSINVDKLQKGFYYVNVYFEDGVQSHGIIRN
jgi:hypothetical protein